MINTIKFLIAVIIVVSCESKREVDYATQNIQAKKYFYAGMKIHLENKDSLVSMKSVFSESDSVYLYPSYSDLSQPTRLLKRRIYPFRDDVPGNAGLVLISKGDSVSYFALDSAIILADLEHNSFAIQDGKFKLFKYSRNDGSTGAYIEALRR